MADNCLKRFWLAWLLSNYLDYPPIEINSTNQSLAVGQLSNKDKLAQDADFDAWIKLYDKRIAQENNPNRIEMMKGANPKYILRNYLAEIGRATYL
jgi:uncharacterized protein YdiU (UPF0061 family)